MRLNRSLSNERSCAVSRPTATKRSSFAIASMATTEPWRGRARFATLEQLRSAVQTVRECGRHRSMLIWSAHKPATVRTRSRHQFAFGSLRDRPSRADSCATSVCRRFNVRQMTRNGSPVVINARSFALSSSVQTRSYMSIDCRNQFCFTT